VSSYLLTRPHERSLFSLSKICLIKQKSDAQARIQRYIAALEIRSDNLAELTSDDRSEYIQSNSDYLERGSRLSR
jgi:hypothetical protein